MNLLRFAPLRHTAALLLGLSLLGTAQAAPVLQDSTRFQVQIDSRSLSGEGWLAFTLLPGALPASGVQVTVSQFSGQWLTDQVREGDVQSSADDQALLLRLGNTTGYNEVLHAVQWGGWLGFELSFSGDYALLPGDVGSNLGIALLAADMQHYVGHPDGNVLDFALMPAQAGSPASLTLALHAPTLAQVSVVPEPSMLALTTLGLCLMMGLTRRKGQGRPSRHLPPPLTPPARTCPPRR